MNINKYTVIILLCLAGSSSFAQSGFKIGLNRSNYYGSGANSGGTGHDFATGNNIGYFIDWVNDKDSLAGNFKTFGFEINIVKKGAVIRNYIFYDDSHAYGFIGDKHINYLSLELPLLLKFVFPISEYYQLKLLFGTSLSSMLELGEYYYSFYPIDIAGLLGMEIAYKRILFDFRYAKGFIKVNDDTYFNSFIFSIGYAILE